MVPKAKLILRPKKHWNSVHERKKKLQKGVMQRSLTFYEAQAAAVYRDVHKDNDMILTSKVLISSNPASSSKPVQSVIKQTWCKKNLQQTKVSGPSAQKIKW